MAGLADWVVASPSHLTDPATHPPTQPVTLESLCLHFVRIFYACSVDVIILLERNCDLAMISDNQRSTHAYQQNQTAVTPALGIQQPQVDVYMLYDDIGWRSTA